MTFVPAGPHEVLLNEWRCLQSGGNTHFRLGTSQISPGETLPRNIELAGRLRA